MKVYINGYGKVRFKPTKKNKHHQFKGVIKLPKGVSQKSKKWIAYGYWFNVDQILV